MAASTSIVAGLGERRAPPRRWAPTLPGRRLACLCDRCSGTAVLSISAPAPARRAEGILKPTAREIASRYRRAQIVATDERMVGGLPARSAIMAVENKGGTQLRVLVTSAKGQRRTYLLTLCTAADALDQRLPEAQLILNSLQLAR